MNRCLEYIDIPEWKTKGKTSWIQNDPQKRSTLPNKYRPITCLPMMLKILMVQITEEINYSLRRSRKTERMPHPQGQQKKMKKCSYGMDWCRKGLQYDPTKLDNRLFQNVQDIQWSHSVYWEYHEKLESGPDSRRKKLNWGETPERNLPGRFTITIIIFDSDDVTESHTWEMHRQIQTS